jgi:hypothetical protein
MKYEAPELIALTPAIDTIQNDKGGSGSEEPHFVDPIEAYEDFED